MLVGRANIRSGDKVLDPSRRFWSGVFGHPMAKLHGAEVAITASTPEKRQGASSGVQTMPGNTVPPKMKFETGLNKRGVDIVLDHVGTDTWSTSSPFAVQRRKIGHLWRHNGVYGRNRLASTFL